MTNPWDGYNALFGKKPERPQHNAHVQLYRIVGGITEIKTRLAKGGYASADCYYGDKHRLHDLEAALVGKKPHEHNPARFWYDNQSN